MERIAENISTVSIFLALVLGGVAAYQHEWVLALVAVGFFVVGYGAYRVAEDEREDREA